jgi:hypothetical protein
MMSVRLIVWKSILSPSPSTDPVPATTPKHTHTLAIPLPDMGLSDTCPTSSHCSLEDLKGMEMTVMQTRNQERDGILPEDVVLPKIRQNYFASGVFSDSCHIEFHFMMFA